MTDPNLHTKFELLKTQIATEHTELMDLLNSIASTIGAPPTAPTATLADVITAITATNALLTASNAITTGIRTDMNAKLTITNDGLLSINQSLDIINNNASTNTQALLAALYATFCGCTTATPILAPPLDVTPTPLEPDLKCQRIQYYISIFTSWLSKIASYTAATGGITADVLGTLLALAATEAGLVATGAEVGSVLGPPGVIVGAIVTAIAGAVYLIGSSFLNDYIVDFNSPIFQHALLEALYAANSADEGQAAFESVIGDYFAAVPGGILSLLWWTAWSNDIYSGVPEVDASAFDSTICAPPAELSCTDREAVAIGAFWQIVFPDETTNTAGDYIGSTVKVLHSGSLVNIVLYHDGTFDIINITAYTSTPYTIAIHTTSVQINVDGGVSGQFGVQWCDSHIA